jgi:hypothetical protein
MSKDHQTIVTKKGNFYYLTIKELKDDPQTVGEAKANQTGTKAERSLPVVAQERPGPS